MTFKSKTCTGSRGFLSEFYSESDAKDCANHINKKYNKDLVAYQCDKCEFWHLTPKCRQTPSKTCDICKGKNGKYKELYDTEHSAIIRAKILHLEKNVLLNVYPCEFNEGFHLTKKPVKSLYNNCVDYNQ